MQVIYCDNHLLIVSKPAGISTQPHPSQEPNCQDLAKAYLKKRFQKLGNVFLEPIHRLDKPVSGIVVFARTSKALSRLQEKMRQHAIIKTYIALVEKPLPLSSSTLEHYLIHEEFHARVVSATHPQAKLARLHYVQIGERGGKSLVEITLETGRYHQIRAQCAAVGSAVVGDEKYGSCSLTNKKRICLHHAQIQLPHPITQEILTFRCEAADF